MINSLPNHTFTKNKFFTLLLLIVVLLSANVANAQKKKKKKKKKHQNLEIVFGLASTYDNNILKYSTKYLERFINNEDEGRFHINAYDDIIVNPTLSSSYTFKLFGKRKSKINLDLSTKKYIVNNIKSFSSFTIGFRQYITKRASFKLYYSYIPSFYIRHFRDEDWVDVYGYTPESFVPMGFSKDSYNFWVQNTFFKNTRIMFSMAYLKYYYNEHFIEYDSKNMAYGLKLYQPVTNKIKIIAGYQFVSSDAKAFDEIGETKETSDDSDGSYLEDIFIIGLNYKLPRIHKMSNYFDIDCRIQKRYFSSTHYLEIDPTHAGRVDDNYRIYSKYTIRLNKKYKLTAFYNYLYRSTTTLAEENVEYLSNEKDYKQFQVGLKLTYTFKK